MSEGGAIFSPFSELSTSKASPSDFVVRHSDYWAADSTMTLVAAAAGVAAIAWLLLRDA